MCRNRAANTRSFCNTNCRRRNLHRGGYGTWNVPATLARLISRTALMVETSSQGNRLKKEASGGAARAAGLLQLPLSCDEPPCRLLDSLTRSIRVAIHLRQLIFRKSQFCRPTAPNRVRPFQINEPARRLVEWQRKLQTSGGTRRPAGGIFVIYFPSNSFIAR